MKVELIDHMGSDLSVVNAARVSFDKESSWAWRDNAGHQIAWRGEERKELWEADKRLIQFLARGMTTDDFDKFVMDLVRQGYEGNPRFIEMLREWRRSPTHFTPFAHPHVTFRCKAPIFVARQLEKHQVGFTWSEVSRRYVDSEPEFYLPETWRKRADNVKQGSSEEAVEFHYQHTGVCNSVREAQTVYDVQQRCLALYDGLLKAGVCPEQARMVLPQSMMTEWIWTGSLFGWANLYNQRKPGSHAQRETQEFARQIADHMEHLFPISWEALTA